MAVPSEFGQRSALDPSRRRLIGLVATVAVVGCVFGGPPGGGRPIDRRLAARACRYLATAAQLAGGEIDPFSGVVTTDPASYLAQDLSDARRSGDGQLARHFERLNWVVEATYHRVARTRVYSPVPSEEFATVSPECLAYGVTVPYI